MWFCWALSMPWTINSWVPTVHHFHLVRVTSTQFNAVRSWRPRIRNHHSHCYECFIRLPHRIGTQYRNAITQVITANLYYKLPLIRHPVPKACSIWISVSSDFCYLHFKYCTCISPEAFTATQFNEMFLGRQPHQDARNFQCFRYWFCPLFQGVVGGLVEPILVLALPCHQQHPESWVEVSPWNARKPSCLDAAICLRTFHWGVYM